MIRVMFLNEVYQSIDLQAYVRLITKAFSLNLAGFYRRGGAGRGGEGCRKQLGGHISSMEGDADKECHCSERLVFAVPRRSM